MPKEIGGRRRIGASIRKYWEIMKISFQSQLAFKTQFLTFIPFEFLSILLLYSFWTAVYLGRTSLGGFAYREMLTYLFIAHIVNAFTAVEVEGMMASKIIGGELSDLVMPLNHQWYIFAQAFSDMIVRALIRSLVALTAGYFLFKIFFPQNGVTAIWVGISVGWSVILTFVLSYLWGLLTIWMKLWHGGYGLRMTKQVMFTFFSGGLVPLALFPHWFQKIAFALPFQGMAHIPVSIYLGRIPPDKIMSAVFSQAVWVLVLWMGMKIIAQRAFRNLEVLESG